MRQWLIPTGVGLAALVLAGSSTVSATDSQPVDVSVFVDQTVCATGPVQCVVQTDHTAEAAGPNNHNPVRLIVQVGSEGTAIAGLQSRDFRITTVAVPAGAGGLEKLKCDSCFVKVEPTSVYHVYVHPQENWYPGTYAVQLRINVGGEEIRALSVIEIPFEK